jgi:hypothetical protein
MRILLVNEASGYHHYLKLGLQELGHDVVHAMPGEQTWQGRTADYFFGNSGQSTVAKLQRNVAPFLKLQRYTQFDVANFLLGLSAFPGRFTKYRDLPILKRKGVRLSYTGSGCDPIALLRVRPDARELPCESCMRHDDLGRGCEKNILGDRKRAIGYAGLVDYAVTPVFEYDHAHAVFPHAIHRRIPLPIAVGSIDFAPATTKVRPVIVHAPTRRGFKGTHVVLEAIKLLQARGATFEFRMVENLSFSDYLKCMQECDIHIDQVLVQSAGIAALESLAMGKVVVSGNGPAAREYFPFAAESPVVNASPDPAALAETLHGLLREKSGFAAQGARGRLFVATHHDHLEIARQFSALWQAQ